MGVYEKSGSKKYIIFTKKRINHILSLRPKLTTLSSDLLHQADPDKDIHTVFRPEDVWFFLDLIFVLTYIGIRKSNLYIFLHME